MIPVYRDEISTRPVGTDFILRLHGEIKFHYGKSDSFTPGICLDLHTFYFNFSP